MFLFWKVIFLNCLALLSTTCFPEILNAKACSEGDVNQPEAHAMKGWKEFERNGKSEEALTAGSEMKL